MEDTRCLLLLVGAQKFMGCLQRAGRSGLGYTLVIQCCVTHQPTAWRHKTRSILLSLWILGDRNLNMAYHRWLVSAPQCLRSPLGGLECLRGTQVTGVMWRLLPMCLAPGLCCGVMEIGLRGVPSRMSTCGFFVWFGFPPSMVAPG